MRRTSPNHFTHYYAVITLFWIQRLFLDNAEGIDYNGPWVKSAEEGQP